MTARAWRSSDFRCRAFAIVAAAAAFPAHAQVAVEGAVTSDYRVRGYSMSDGDPAASLSLSYDDPSGVYVGALAVGSIVSGDPDLAGFEVNAGYAQKLSPTVSLDAGVSRSQYYYAYGSQHLHYTEAYLGIAGPLLSARVHYSPDYYRSGTSTLYAELNGGIEPATDWLLSAHAGVLSYLDNRPSYLPRERYDWRIGATRRFGATGLHLDLTGRVQGHTRRYATNATALVVSLTHAF